MDSHSHAGCRFYNLPPEFSVRDLAAFHGHLGPYIVLGYRIGKYVREKFCDDPFRLKATVYCSGTPPQSCLADGVQLGSGCTLGKRNIDIVVSDQLKCTFSADGKTIAVTPRAFRLPDKGKTYEEAIEAIAEEMYHQSYDELFEVSVES